MLYDDNIYVMKHISFLSSRWHNYDLFQITGYVYYNNWPATEFVASNIYIPHTHTQGYNYLDIFVPKEYLHFIIYQN